MRFWSLFISQDISAFYVLDPTTLRHYTIWICEFFRYRFDLFMTHINLPTFENQHIQKQNILSQDFWLDFTTAPTIIVSLTVCQRKMNYDRWDQQISGKFKLDYLNFHRLFPSCLISFPHNVHYINGALSSQWIYWLLDSTCHLFCKERDLHLEGHDDGMTDHDSVSSIENSYRLSWLLTCHMYW